MCVLPRELVTHPQSTYYLPSSVADRGSLLIVVTVAVDRRIVASFLACDCSRRQAGVARSKLGGSRRQAVVFVFFSLFSLRLSL